MKKIIRKEFKLKKFKLLEGLFQADFSYDFAKSGDVFENEINYKDTRIPHPDIYKFIDELKPVVARIYGYDVLRTICLNDDFKATGSQAEILEKLYQKFIGNITVTGFSVSGEDDKKQCIITAKVMTELGVSAINTNKILLLNDKFGFEEELENIIDSLTDEVYSYIYEGKDCMPSLFTTEEQMGKVSDALEEDNRNDDSSSEDKVVEKKKRGRPSKQKTNAA